MLYNVVLHYFNFFIVFLPFFRALAVGEGKIQLQMDCPFWIYRYLSTIALVGTYLPTVLILLPVPTLAR